jgi:hypothetical protein
VTPDILLVTSWDVPCGIAEHSRMLTEAIDPGRFLIADDGVRPLPPEQVRQTVETAKPAILHLNYHASLHSQYTPEWIPVFQKLGAKVVITFHDTGVPNSPLARALCDAADAFIIHEPADDLPRAHYWRMGVPTLSTRSGGMAFGAAAESQPTEDLAWHNPSTICFKAYQDQPVLGSVGFPFPWKNYAMLAAVSAEMGWALMLLAPTATYEQIAEWRAINPYLYVQKDFANLAVVQSYLMGCDATAFTYVCHNTGQSGAVLQGIGARKPVIALKTCRQFRALYDDKIGRATIKWAETFEDVAAHLRNIKLQRVDPGIVALAEQESWTKLGLKYSNLYQELSHGTR